MPNTAVHAGRGAEGGDNLSLGAVVELWLVVLGYDVGQLGGESCRERERERRSETGKKEREQDTDWRQSQ